MASTEEVLTIYVYGTFPPAPHSFAPFPVPPAVAPIPQAPVFRAPSASPPLALLTHAPTSEPTITVATTTLLPTTRSSNDTIAITTAPTTLSQKMPSPPMVPSVSDARTGEPSTVTTTSAPVSMPPTTLVPTDAPTEAPTTGSPTLRPSTLYPTSLAPISLSPITSIPTTLSPTRTDWSGSTGELTTTEPTLAPTIYIADILRDTDASTESRKLVEMIVPIEFLVHVVLGANETIEDVRNVWQDHLQSVLVDTFGMEPGVTVVEVALDTTEPDAAGNVRTTGQAIFAIDESVVDWKDLSIRAHSVLAEATTVEQLQMALERDAAEVGDGVADTESLEKPSTARIVVGFTILFFTLLSLLFWARLLWRKRRKTLRRRRLEELRKAQSTTAFAPTAPPVPVVPPPLSDEQQREMMKSMQKESSVDCQQASVGETETTNSDPFAAELQRAVSLDRVAWDEFQKQREAFEQETGNMSRDAGLHTSEVTASGTEVHPHLSMSTYSYPYGDEGSKGAIGQSQDPLSNLSALSPIALSAMSHADQSSRFEPYGDESRTMLFDEAASRSQSSKHMPTIPQSPAEPYRYMHPQFSDEETPTSRAMHDSVDVTTIDSPMSAVVDENTPAEAADDDPPESLTDSMMREVQSVANFLRQYEQKQKSKPRRLFRQRGRQNASEGTHGKSEPKPKTSARDTSLGAQDMNARGTSLAPVFSRSGARTALKPVSTQRTSLPQPFRESSHQANDVEQARPEQGRLGINQFSLGSPLSQMASYKFKQSSGGVVFRGEGAPTVVSSVPSEDALEFVRSGTTQRTTISGLPPNIYEPSPADDPDFASLGEQPSGSLQSQQSRLSSLRSSESILDITPSEDFSYTDIGSGGTETQQITTASTQESALQHTDSSSLRPTRKKVSPRSTNLMFNNIRSFFEEKVTEPIVPPSDTWQYTGAQPKPGGDA